MTTSLQMQAYESMLRENEEPAMPYTLDEQIAELRREARLRPRVFDRWVAAGSLTRQQADERIGRLQAAIATLEGLRDAEKSRVTPGLF